MNWKKIGQRILFPNPVFIWLLWLVAAGWLTHSFLAFEPTDAGSIASYVLSFYALTVSVLWIPKIIRLIWRFKQENRYVLRYTSDVQLRMNISLYGATVFHTLYAVFQLCLGLWHHSVWFYAMAAYYLLLALMRLQLARYTLNHAPGEQCRIEWRKYRLCGVFLMFMNFALGVMITYFVLKIRTFRHHEITTIAMAAYTFVSFGVAIRNVIRYKRYGSPVYSAAKAISLVCAIVSMLTLENAMLTTFGTQESELFQQTMLGGSGIAVMLAVQGIALYMITNAKRNLRA